MKTKFGNAKVGSHGYFQITTNNKYHLKLLHRLIYEEYYGKIPENHHIHHIDGNKLNNDPKNLELLPKSEHHRMHSLGREHTIEDRKKMSRIKQRKSNKNNQTGFYRVYKEKGKQYAQGFTYTYEVDTSRLDGKKRKKKKIRRIKISELEKAVKEAGYEWREV